MACSEKAEMPGRVNGSENIPKPFVIGVSGGTASGKDVYAAFISSNLDNVVVTTTNLLEATTRKEMNYSRNIMKRFVKRCFCQYAPSSFILGVAGGSAAGKSSVCSKIVEQLGEDKTGQKQPQVVVISQDNFYRNLTEKETVKAYKGQFNFDHPNALDFDLMHQTLQNIKSGKAVQIPHYSFVTHSRVENESTTIYPADVVLFEGILVFYWKELLDMFHMKLFVDSDPDTRLARRVLRDTKERGRELDQVLNQYTNFVKPAFEEFCLPTKKHADVIIPRGADNTVAIDLIVQHIRELLRPKKGQEKHKLIARKESESGSGISSRPH